MDDVPFEGVKGDSQEKSILLQAFTQRGAEEGNIAQLLVGGDTEGLEHLGYFPRLVLLKPSNYCVPQLKGRLYWSILYYKLSCGIGCL